MTHDEIKKEAESFFKSTNGICFTTDAIAFAKHCVDKATGWRPIADAPKDATPVLAWLPEDNCQGIVYFHEQTHMWYEGWRPCDAPTHWKPLPPAPEAA